MYKLLYHPRTAKQIKKLGPQEKTRVADKIKKLVEGPFSGRLDIKKLTNARASFRLRIGNVRVIFEINEEKELIFIMDIDYRGQIY